MKKLILVLMVVALGILLSVPQYGTGKDTEYRVLYPMSYDELGQISFTVKETWIMLDMFEQGNSVNYVALAIGANPRDVYAFWTVLDIRTERVETKKVKTENDFPPQLSFTMDQISLMTDMILMGIFSADDIAKAIGADPYAVDVFWNDMYLRSKRFNGGKGGVLSLPVSRTVRLS